MSRTTFRFKITDEETIKQINPINQQLVESFLMSFDTKSSDASVKNYRSDFNIFFCWNVLKNGNKSFIEIKKSDLIAFFSFAVNTLKWGSSRYRRMHSALSSLSNFIVNILDDDYPNFKNLMPKIDKIPKVATREKTVLTETQVDNLLNYLRTDIENIQWACLLALAIGSGARISELFRFTIDIIDENSLAFNDIFLKTKKEIKTKGMGKLGEKKYKYIIKDIFLPIYKEWLPIREQIMKENGVAEHGYIFITKSGTPATDKTSRRWIEQWEKYLTEKEPSNENQEQVHLYPHCLRHYIVTYLTRIGLSSDLIIAIMGWKSAEMYKIYNDLSDDEREWKDLEKLDAHLKKLTDKE
jgi:integrase